MKKLIIIELFIISLLVLVLLLSFLYFYTDPLSNGYFRVLELENNMFVIQKRDNKIISTWHDCSFLYSTKKEACNIMAELKDERIEKIKGNTIRGAINCDE